MQKLLASSILLALSATGANAATISFSDSFPGPAPATDTTNWVDTLELSQFDPSLGTLTGVEFSATATVDGNASAESQDAAPATVTLAIGADVEIDMSAAGIANFLFSSVGQSVTENLAAFDGNIDFAGDSGFAAPGLSGSESDAASATDLSLFTGADILLFNAESFGASTGSGAGNLITQFQTNAGVELEVIYTFDEDVPPVQVPVPAPLALLGLGLAALGIRRARKA